MSPIWSKPWVRKAAAVAILAAAVCAQVFFKNIPWPLDIADTDKIRNPSAALATQEFVLTGATVMPNHELLSYDGNAWEVADMDFGAAELGQETATFLALSKDGAPPGQAGPWHYVTFEKEDAPAGETCRTFIHVSPVNPAAPPGEFHLYQLGRRGLNHFREIEFKADSAALVVDAHTAPPDPRKPDAPGCWKTLQSGNWQTQVRNFPVRFMVRPNSTVRITFVSASANAPSWGGADNYFKSAQIGPLLAQGLTLRAIQEDGSVIKAPPALQFSAYHGTPMKIKDMELGSEDVKASVTGKAWIKENGKTMGFDLLDAVMKNPTLGAIIAAGNALLLAFLRKLFFGKSETQEVSTATG